MYTHPPHTPHPHSPQTDRALLIDWPGHTEGLRVGMRKLVQPGPRSFDWRVGEQRLEGLSSTRMTTAIHERTALPFARTARPEQVVYMTCNEAFFVDLVSNPHHRARVHRLGLAHPDRVFSLLSLVVRKIIANYTVVINHFIDYCIYGMRNIF